MKGIVWLASYPKSGNTWFRIFLANLLADQPEPVDINAVGVENFGCRPNYDRALGWESSDLTQEEIFQARLDVQEELALEKNVLFKVHESFRRQLTGTPLFSRTATRAALYFLRNPLDVVLSFSHHNGKDIDNTIARMNCSDAMMAAGRDALAPQLPQPTGDWSWHVRSWLDEPGLPVMALRYEDMLARPQEVFRAACQFAGLPSEPDRVARALAHAKFENLRAQEQARGFRESAERRPFFRQGKAGGWREVLSDEQVAAIVSAHGEVMRRFGYLNADGSLPK
ncbi:MAG: sulfotransferase domain-containing protein [Proteobacteria bacterium]|nr:sulfotransferase domain-containing protein [Pseudomonadota bacterium]